MFNCFKALNLFEYIKKIEFTNLNVKDKKIWKNNNKRFCVIVRMRFDLNVQKFVKNKLLVKKIWNIIAKEFKFKKFDYVNLIYEVLNNCKLFFFLVDNYCDKFIKLVFKVEIFVLTESVNIFKI